MDVGIFGLVPGVDENIVDVDNDNLEEELLQHLIYVPLKFRG